MAVVVDLAGGAIGGAGRFRAQYLAYAAEDGAVEATCIGLREHVTAPWLLRREVHARGATKVVATNNVSFAMAGASRWTLLHNANQFLSRTEWARSVGHLGRAFAAQVAVVRLAARRSEVLVVPSSSMADRVSTALPDLAERIVVRLQPLRVPDRPRDAEASSGTVLCPIVHSPYKNLAAHLELLQAALGDRRVRVVCTIGPADATPALRADDRFSFLGMLDQPSLESRYAEAAAVYFPTSIESFGYPLAEARAAGLPVLAQDTAHNREVAGAALFGFRSGDARSLADALAGALAAEVPPDPAPFDPRAYFDWLLG
ncbi:glycosyltransferase [Geodermatophilus sp. CPCC 205506]|uniref:glycosyltransferase n=1 Tax=Geodermatophilus sp. CPCC 205506 TaxID=2936596 RepID=UPI003EE9B574